MSQLAALLKEYLERSTYRSITGLAQAAQSYAPVSRSYLGHILQGTRQNPAYDKLLAIAQALELDVADTQRLLAVAGLPAGEREPEQPATAGRADPDAPIRPALAALRELAGLPGVSPEQVRLVVDSLVLHVQGLKAALAGQAGAAAMVNHGSPSLAPTAVLRPFLRSPAAALAPEESLIDDLLGEILARGEEQPLAALFASLEEVAGGDSWEAKRRIAEALPRLVQLQPAATLRLAGQLRQDYHPDYRADIRRRVVEAAPALYSHRPQDTQQLLAARDGDEVYTALATAEALHDLARAGLLPADAAASLAQSLRLEEPAAREALASLRRLLPLVEADPDQALAQLQAGSTHPERLSRIVVLRLAPRLLAARPGPVLDLLAYFLRPGPGDRPAEHANLRRPVSRALPDILALLPPAPPERRAAITRLLHALAADPDIHVRRALADALDQLAGLDAALAADLLDTLLPDPDPYVRQRAWQTLLRLADLYPEEAGAYYARLLTEQGE